MLGEQCGTLPIFLSDVKARHSGFTEEELDSIPSAKLRAGINYDLRLRVASPPWERAGQALSTAWAAGPGKIPKVLDSVESEVTINRVWDESPSVSSRGFQPRTQSLFFL
jgi:hypothetical protein